MNKTITIGMFAVLLTALLLQVTPRLTTNQLLRQAPVLASKARRETRADKYLQSRWSYIVSNRLSLRRAGCQTVLVEPAAPRTLAGGAAINPPAPQNC